ncbi:MAG: HipA domain-containing protein [Solirubrobacterales bacterium]|nr:HipA domain-containing protein [Solirubrobacterales bacterium]OJU94443.1 MAG: hypothetical protein BGO23_03305 [Solirubrobacterales bacterium 67-14]
MASRGKERLTVWLDDRPIASLTRGEKPGHVNCAYADEAFNGWAMNTPLISCSLPLVTGPQEATPFFRGLLPEGNALRILAEKANVVVTDTFGMLQRYGKDVAGALVVASEPPDASLYKSDSLDEGHLAEVIRDLDENPLGIVDDSELSLAGMQDKVLLVKDSSGWARPRRGMPSTHILKVNDLAHARLVRSEGECLDLARSVGLTTVENEIQAFSGRDCIIVSRYDRTREEGRVRRLHQEDICQALGVDPMVGERVKYESHGGPGLKDVAKLLDDYADDAQRELDRLVEAVTFTVLIGNADQHGKNLSLLHGPDGEVSLAPLYDTVPTVLWPELRSSGAMSIGAQPVLADVTIAAIGREAKRWKHSESRAIDVATQLVHAVTDALAEDVIPDGSPVRRYVESRAADLTSS